MKRREIEKNPLTPHMSDKAISLITNLCFRQDDAPTRADLIFIFGTHHNVGDVTRIAHRLLVQNLAPAIVITGGIPSYEGTSKLHRAECDIIMERLATWKFPDVKFHTEKSSENTLENVRNTVTINGFGNIRRLIYVFKSHACRRGYLTLRKTFPEAELIQQSYSVSYIANEPRIERDNWWIREFGRSRVWGEFLRIEHYGLNGTIAYPEQVRDEVAEIRGLLD